MILQMWSDWSRHQRSRSKSCQCPCIKKILRFYTKLLNDSFKNKNYILPSHCKIGIFNICVCVCVCLRVWTHLFKCMKEGLWRLLHAFLSGTVGLENELESFFVEGGSTRSTESEFHSLKWNGLDRGVCFVTQDVPAGLKWGNLCFVSCECFNNTQQNAILDIHFETTHQHLSRVLLEVLFLTIFGV